MRQQVSAVEFYSRAGGRTSPRGAAERSAVRVRERLYISRIREEEGEGFEQREIYERREVPRDSRRL